MKVIAFLPVKGSSNRIENKNLKLLDGKPLFLHSLEKLLSCEFIDEVYLDTESTEIIEAATHLNCKIMKRDPELATNETDGNRLFLNEVLHSDADIYIQLLGTSPFILPETIKKGVDELRKPDSHYDSAVLIRKERLYTWDESGPTYDICNIPNSVDLVDTIIETMGLYLVKRDCALRTRRRIGDTPLLIEASTLEAVDVNWPEDFELANLLAGGIRENSRKLLGNIKSHLTSPLLSDLLDDLGYDNQIIKGLKPNFVGSKILGRAKTLKLRELREGEDFRGIYGALQSYSTVVPGDVIVVENEVPGFAYFGELNASLAVRCGAEGVIIGGNTRDSSQVRQLGLTVFSRGYTCQDVRRRATLESINKVISVDGITIKPEDLIFADSEGVVVIPRETEEDVLKKVFHRIANEEKILIDLSLGSPVDQLVEKYGFF